MRCRRHTRERSVTHLNASLCDGHCWQRLAAEADAQQAALQAAQQTAETAQAALQVLTQEHSQALAKVESMKAAMDNSDDKHTAETAALQHKVQSLQKLLEAKAVALVRSAPNASAGCASIVDRVLWGSFFLVAGTSGSPPQCRA